MSLQTARHVDNAKSVIPNLVALVDLCRGLNRPEVKLIQMRYRSESELAINIRKATSIEESAPKRKHVRSCIVYTWDHRSSQSFWAGMKVCV